MEPEKVTAILGNMTEDQWKAALEEATRRATCIARLRAIITPSTEHMNDDERGDCIEVMLDDLEQLTRRDGCIAAAWALEFIAPEWTALP